MSRVTRPRHVRAARRGRPAVSLRLRAIVTILLPFLCSVLATQANGQNVVKSDFRAASGYTFFAPVTSPISYLIDNQGKIVRQWTGDGGSGLVVYLLPNGHLLRTGTVTSEAFGAFASSGGRIDEFDADGSLVWSYTLSTDRYLRHHDVEPLPNGNILMISWDVRTAEEAIANGRDPDRIAGGGFWAEAIFEVRPIRPSGGKVVWEWHAWDHLAQDFDASRKNYTDVAAHPELMDINFGPQTPDWLHFNAVSYNAELDQIVVSSRTLSEIWVIDHSTTTEEAAGHSGGRSGKGGDILYRWGNPQVYRAGGPAGQRLIDQHCVYWIDPGLPGAGNLLVFSNGGARDFSTVEEIVPPVDENGVYSRVPGAAFGPDNAVWSYGENAQPRFRSRTFGGVQRLPNGNTLICISNEYRMIEVTPEGEAVWEADISDIPLIRSGGGTFRATRIPVNFDGLRGTGLYRPAPELVSAASKLGGATAPSALVVASGRRLGASATPVLGRALPATLDGAGVEVMDALGVRRKAGIVYASPSHILFQIPAESAIGPARVTVGSGDGRTQMADIRIDPVAPALFSANGDGRGVGAIIAVHMTPDGRFTEPAFIFDLASRRFVSRPISPGNEDEEVRLLLFGTGIRDVDAPDRLSITIGGTPAPVIASAPAIELPWLDRIEIGPLPLSLAGSGEQSIVMSAGNKTSNSVSIRFR